MINHTSQYPFLPPPILGKLSYTNDKNVFEYANKLYGSLMRLSYERQTVNIL